MSLKILLKLIWFENLKLVGNHPHREKTSLFKSWSPGGGAGAQRGLILFIGIQEKNPRNCFLSKVICPGKMKPVLKLQVKKI